MSKKETTVHTILADGQGMTWDNEKLENKNSIVFLLSLDIGQKVEWGLVNYKFLDIRPVFFTSYQPLVFF